MKKHEENKDVMLLNRSGIKVNESNKTIVISYAYQASKPIGLKRWARVDFLVNHCGYVLLREDNTVVSKDEVKEASNKDKAKLTRKNKDNEYSKKKMKKA